MFREQKDQLNKLLRIIEDDSISTTIKDTLNGLEKISSYLALNPDIEKKLIEPEQKETMPKVGIQNLQSGNVLPPDDPLFEFKQNLEGYEIIRYKGSDLTEIEIPDYHQGRPVNKIGIGVFQKTPLKTVIMGQNIRFIEDIAFSECKQLERVIRSEVVSYIERGAFRGCKKLSKFDLSPNLVFLGKGAFHFTGLRSITIPDSLVYICCDTFAFCEKLNNVRLSANLQAIGDCAFQFCSSLSKVEIPDNVSYIGESAFENCKALKKCYIYGKNVVLGSNVFNTTYAYQPDKRYKVRYLERPNPLLTVYGRTKSSVQDYCTQAGIAFKKFRKACSIPEPTRKPIDKRLKVGYYKYISYDYDKYTLRDIYFIIFRCVRKDIPFIHVRDLSYRSYCIIVDEALTQKEDTMAIISQAFIDRGFETQICDWKEMDEWSLLSR